MKHRSSRYGMIARTGVMLIGTGFMFAAGTQAHAESAGPFAILPASSGLTDARLATIRGGFDLTPQITVNFAYQQITSVNGTVIAAIAIPQIQISLGAHMAPQVSQASISAPPTLTNTGLPSAAGTASVTNPAPVTTTTIPTAPVSSLGTPTTVSPASNGPATTTPVLSQLIGTAPVISRYGNTSVSTQLNTAGVSTVITNMANNVLIQNRMNVDIGMSGMPAALASQAQAMFVTQAMTDATQRFH